MAEFALGLTKTAVEGTLVRVKSAIDAEAEIKEKVQNDLVFITEEFEMMRSFLYAANTAERAKNPVVRTWVRQLRKLAFDVEDCVEFVVHLETKKSDWWWRVVPSCIAPPLPVDVAVARIQQLKARVEDISKRNARYNLLGDDNSMPQNQLVPATAVSSSPFGVLSEVWQAAGKLRTTGDLTKLITSEGKDLQVISLWQGSCSTGASHYHHLEATYIIKKAYDDSEICQRFKSRAWIKLMHPFDLDEFLKALLALFYPPTFSNHQSQEQSEELGGAELASHNKKAGAEFRKKMRAAVTEEDDSFKAELMHQVSKERRYLLVLEGVSTVVDWEAIRMYLPDSNNGSRIVVSTEHLRIALLCTREPYQVSQLTRFSDGQFLYAFSKKGSVRRSDIGEFNWQITRGVVISVVGNFPRIDLHGGEISVVPQVYECIRLKRKEFDGVVFEEHSWVDVPRPFDINKFAVVLFLNFQSRGFQAKEIAEVGSKGDQGVIERCCKYLHENDCLVVINGLEARKDWDEIKTTFLSKPTNCTRTKLSIIVVTDDETVAKHCAPDQQNRVFDIKALEQDEVLNRLINKDTGSSRGLEDSGRAPLIYNQRIEAGCWAGFEFDDRRQKELSTLREQLRHPNTSVISVWGRSGVGKSTLVRGIYYEKVIEYFSPLGNFSWADVPHSFDLTDFSWHLLLDFQSTHEEKVAAAAGLMKGQDPIQACRKILHEKKYMVVIDGLQSKQDWDIIRKTFFSELHTQSGSHIIVITNEKSVAKHSVDDKEDQLLKVKPLRDRDSLRLPLVKFMYLNPVMYYYLQDPGFFVGRVKEKRVLTQHQHWSGTFTLVIALWGIAGVGKSALVRNIYKNYKEVGYGGGKQQKMSWVDVPHPFRLMEFSRRLLLGFYSKDLHAQETAAVGIMEGQDTIQACCHFLQQYVCVIVIDGLRSTHDWDSIKAAFLSEPTQSSRIIVITTEETVATHCALDKRRVHNLKGLDAKDALRLFKEIAGGSRRLASKMDRVKLIMAKCGGLPQVIYVIAQEISKTNSEYDPETAMATILGRPSPDEDDCESTSSEDSLSSEEDGVGTVDSDSLMRIQPPLPASTGGDETSRSQLAASDGDCTREKLSGTSKGEDTSISQSVLAADGEGTSTSQPPPAGDDVTSINYDDTSRRPQDDDRASTTRAPCRSKARNAVVSYSCSWWSKKLCASQQIDGNFGVEAPAEGIGKLTALQTFGVVNVGGAHGKSVLKELKKLTQLRKLGVCGINRENWQDLCCNMLGYGHLKSLSVHLDKDEDGESFFSSTGAMFNSLPKNLKSLKLYTGDGHGNVLVPWVWMKQLGNLSSLTKVNLGLAISTQDDIDSFKEFPDQVTFRHICVKPTQDCELRYYTKYRGWQGLGSQFLKIDCGSYKLVIAFEGWIAKDVEVLVVHCSSTESSLKLSGLEWLESLKEVVLKGPYSEVVKQHLQEQVARTTLLYGLKPVLKLEDGESHQSREPKDPAAPSACCHTCASCCFNGITSTCK
ncbi:hypothetical protein ACQ4PT_029325 [Festuca glaucescens]